MRKGPLIYFFMFSLVLSSMSLGHVAKAERDPPVWTCNGALNWHLGMSKTINLQLCALDHDTFNGDINFSGLAYSSNDLGPNDISLELDGDWALHVELYNLTRTGVINIGFIMDDYYNKVQVNTTLVISPPDEPIVLLHAPRDCMAFSDMNFAYPLKAVTFNHPDNITYNLKQGPDGFIINDGLIDWSPTGKDIGTHRIVINITDGSAHLEYVFNITVYKKVIINIDSPKDGQSVHGRIIFQGDYFGPRPTSLKIILKNKYPDQGDGQEEMSTDDARFHLESDGRWSCSLNIIYFQNGEYTVSISFTVHDNGTDLNYIWKCPTFTVFIAVGGIYYLHDPTFILFMAAGIPIIVVMVAGFLLLRYKSKRT